MKGKKILLTTQLWQKQNYFILRMASSFYAMARVFVTHFLVTDEKVSLHREI